MNEQDRMNVKAPQKHAAGTGSLPASHAQSQPQRTPYQRQHPHVTQGRIDYSDIEQPASNGGNRKHMGVATSDPEYLPPAKNSGYVPPSSPTLRIRANERSGAAQNATATSSGQLHYERYLSTPKKGRAIFTSRQDRQRHRIHLLLAVLITAAIALALVWLLFLR